MNRHPPRSIPFLLALTGALCTASTRGAEAPSVEDRLRALESQVQRLAEENDALRKELGWDGKKPLNLVEDRGRAASVGIGGYIQVQAGFGDAPDPRFALLNEADGFDVRRARINAYGRFLEHFDFKIEGEFAGLGSGLRAQLTDGWVNWNRYDFLNFKAGQYKTHFGYEQLLPDTATQFIERSYANDRLTAGRQIGVSVMGSVMDKRLSYAAGLFNGNNINNSVNDGNDFMGTAHAEGLPVKTRIGETDLALLLGINGLVSEDTSASIPTFGFRTNPTGTANNLFKGRRAGVSADAQFTVGRLTLQEELLWMHYRPDSGNLTATPLDDDFSSLGVISTATFALVPHRLDAHVRYEWMDTQDDVGNADSESFSLGLSYYIKGHDFQLKGNYVYGKIDSTGNWRGRFLARLQAGF